MNKINQQHYTTLNNGVQMPLLGLGVYAMYGKEAESAILKALETGYRLIDTAAMYRNETEVGNAIRKSGITREEIFVITKVANYDQGFESTLRAYDESLQRLGLDYVDLYLMHWPVKGQRRDTWKALEKLYADKRVRAVGTANYLLPFLEELKTYTTVIPALNQVEFTPYLFLKNLLDYCNAHQIQLQSYSPIARGRKNSDPKLVTLAEKYDKTIVQIMLRWAIQHNVSTIPKSSNPKRIEENFDIFDFEISEEDMMAMDNFHENFRVAEDPMEMW